MEAHHPESEASIAYPDKPIPRPPRSRSRLALLRVRNRRLQYLELHPSYFDNTEHELADPVLYERLITRFQTAAERQADDQSKGYAHVLEADLARGEMRASVSASAAGSLPPLRRRPDSPTSDQSDIEHPWMGFATDKEHGRRLWQLFLRERFVDGRDDDFDYGLVDGNEDYDHVARRDAQDLWFDQEEPAWTSDGNPGSGGAAAPAPRGETGIQDF